MMREYERLRVAVGREGKTSQRASLMGATGGWESSVNAVNALIGDLVQPINSPLSRRR